MKSFNIPAYYKSSFISQIKSHRKEGDPRKQDFSPVVLDFGPLKVLIARHFGFCYGVENAVEISYKALEENPDKRIFLLSEMIHNPTVNKDLQERGISYIMNNLGKQLIPWDEINSNDIVITPAFGTTLEIQEVLRDKGIVPEQYNTTCPFVVKVWKTADKLGKKDFSIVIHGKPTHEETRATFSHSEADAPSIIVRNIEESRMLGEYIQRERALESILPLFKDRCSPNFNFVDDFKKVGVVNQTTMLASETHEIAQYFKSVLIQKYGEENIKEHFADTRDTLCYATNDNQRATFGLLEKGADLAVVVGGYNSSNTSHLVELCEQKFPTYFISSAEEIESKSSIHHFDLHSKQRVHTEGFLSNWKEPVNIILTSGASCPDSMVEQVLDKLLSYFPEALSKKEVLKTTLEI